MDRSWSRPSTIPEKLYRVICPNQHTHYDPKIGLVAGTSLPRESFIARQRLPAFYASIASHRDQTRTPSPWISLYESLPEAEIFCIAAADFHGSDETCFIIELDLRCEEMQGIPLFYVHDVQVTCPPGVQLGIGPSDAVFVSGGMKGSVKGGRWDSEWLALWAVPGGRGMRVLKNGRGCRIDLEWDGTNDLATYEPPKPTHYKEYVDRDPIVDIWEGCNLCKTKKTCTHGFEAMKRGTVFTEQLQMKLEIEYQNAFEYNNRKAWEKKEEETKLKRKAKKLIFNGGDMGDTQVAGKDKEKGERRRKKSEVVKTGGMNREDYMRMDAQDGGL